MEFSGFKVWPSARRKPLCLGQEQRRIGEILESAFLLSHLPKAKEIVVQVGDPVMPGVSISEAYDSTREATLQGMQTPPGFQRQELTARCPEGLVSIVVQCINEARGVGSYWGFAGYGLLALVDIKQGRIWDVRGCEAT
jgi:hypothetical protein